MIHLRLPLFIAPLAGASLAMSVRYGLWLVVLAATAFVVVVVRHELRSQWCWLPIRIALRALLSAQPPDGVRGCDDLACAELAVVAKGRLGVLDRAIGLAHEEDDPVVWSGAVSRLVIARDLLGRGRIGGLVETAEPSTGRLAAWVAGTVGCFAGTVATTSGWWLVPLLVTWSGAVLVWTDWRDDRLWRPARVLAAARAGHDYLPDDNDHRVAVQLSGFAGGRSRPLVRAQAIVNRWDGSEPAQMVAGRRLELAAGLIETSSGSGATAWRARAAGVATAASAAATWHMTG